MNPLLIRDAAHVLGVSSEKVFGLAEEWTEHFIPRKKVCQDFQNWYFDGTVPDYVEDFTLDILAGRVKPIKLLK